MRNLVIFLGLLAWVLTCFDTVSTMRARENERTAQAEERKTDDSLASLGAQSDADNELLRHKLEKDQIAVETDEFMVQHARASGRNTLREQHVLAADKATLDADRIVAYNNEDLARTNPEPRVAAAHESLDVYRREQAEAQATRARDRILTRALIAFWVLIIALGFWTARTHATAPPRVSNQP